MEFDEEVQLCLFKNINWAFGLYLDNMLASGQYDTIFRWLRQNDKNVGHHNWQFDQKFTKLAHKSYNKNTTIYKISYR